MIGAKLNWSGAQRLAELQAASWNGIQRCVAFLHSAILQEINVSAGPVRVKRARGRGSFTRYTNPSRPGFPPHKRTGQLQRHVVFSLDKRAGTGYVGVAAAAQYGLFLEMGTRNMQPRPFLLWTLRKHRDRLRLLARSA